MLENIPKEFLFLEDREEDVSIIIGENGCGKSTLLGYLANYHCIRGKEVIGIANSIHDKFDYYHNKLYTLKARSGRRQIKDTIKNALKTVSIKENEQGLRNAASVLKYIGFDPAIGFKLKNFKIDFEATISDSELISEKDKNNLLSILTKLKYDWKFKEITWFSMYNNYYKNIESYSFTILFPYETILKKLKIIDDIDIYLLKQNKPIPVFHASSGELALISSIIFISTIIKSRNTVILIDEPENSLHPKWQREYVETLIDVFYYYQPKIIIATHSPMILNGAKQTIKNISIYKADNFKFYLQKMEPNNIEETFYQLFEITTPENRFLSNLLVTYLNDLTARNIDIENFRQRIKAIERSIYDNRQKELLIKVNEIADEIYKN